VVPGTTGVGAPVAERIPPELEGAAIAMPDEGPGPPVSVAERTVRVLRKVALTAVEAPLAVALRAAPFGFVEARR
jgi:hypothetical protein